jgi:hypothetical protein
VRALLGTVHRHCWVALSDVCSHEVTTARLLYPPQQPGSCTPLETRLLTRCAPPGGFLAAAAGPAARVS